MAFMSPWLPYKYYAICVAVLGFRKENAPVIMCMTGNRMNMDIRVSFAMGMQKAIFL